MPLPIFYDQIVPVSSQTFALGGNRYVFNLPRESVIEKINLYVEGVVGTAATAAAIEGLSKLISSVTVRGSLSGQPELVPISGLSGPDLFEAAVAHSGVLPQTIGALNATGKFRVNIPLYFREQFFGDEPTNLLTAIPAFQMSDLTLTVVSETLANVDLNSVLALSSAVIGLEIEQSYRDTIPAGIQFIRGQFEVLEDNNIVTQTTREVKLPSGGDYTFLLMRAYSAANAKQLDSSTTPAPLNQPGTIKLYDLSRFTKIETDFLKLRARNLQQTVDDTLTAGNAFIAYNRSGPSGIFQTGQAGIALNNITVVYDAVAAANSKVRFVYRRLFDPANLLKIARP